MTAIASLPRRRKAERRHEILGAARTVFSAKDFDAASISEIASLAGCVEGTIYTYFRNKRELFDAVLVEFYDALIADIAPRFETLRDTRDRLCYLIARHMRIPFEDPGVGRMIRQEARAHETYFGSALHGLNRRYSRFLVRTLTEGVERGELRADLNVSMARDLVFGGIEHWIHGEIGRHRTVDAAHAADAMVRMLLDGWRAAPAEDPYDRLERRIDRLEAKLKSVERKT